jgi:flavin reductase (DIM6/NTAB) family NADH-FMN oxidoreductase RutF
MATTTGAVTDLSEIMDMMPYGLYIVGSMDTNHELNGMMADWVMQTSFKPRLLGVSFENDSHTLAAIRANGWFTVNYLPANEDGRHLAAKFAQPFDGAKVLGRTENGKQRLHHKMDSVAHAITGRGVPVLDGAMAWVECRATQFIPSGDHTLILGEVVNGKLLAVGEPLTSIYTGWTYSG